MPTSSPPAAVSSPCFGGLDAPDGGGEIDLTAGGQIQLDGSLDVRGSQGGTVNLKSGGALSVGVVMGNATGEVSDGGSITIEAGTTLQVTDQITANGETSPLDGGGSGGTVTLTAGFGDLTLVAGSGVHADGADPDGDAGEVDLLATGAVRILKSGTTLARVTASGGGCSGCAGGGGGLIDIEPSLNFQHDGAIDASGGGFGGEVDVTAGTDVTLNGLVDISGRGYGSGGGTASIEAGIEAPGALTIANTLDVTAFATCDIDLGCGSGGSTTLIGCNVTITAAGTVTARAPAGGSNSVLAYEQLTIAGKLVAHKTVTTGSDGTNILDYPSRKPASLAVSAVNPAPTQNARDTCTSYQQPNCLVPCPTCGNGIVEFPESCDNDLAVGGAPPHSCDGCSIFCQIENCDDHLQCTTDSCDPALGCLSLPVTAPCTEGPTRDADGDPDGDLDADGVVHANHVPDTKRHTHPDHHADAQRDADDDAHRDGDGDPGAAGRVRGDAARRLPDPGHQLAADAQQPEGRPPHRLALARPRRADQRERFRQPGDRGHGVPAVRLRLECRRTAAEVRSEGARRAACAS